MDAIAVIPARGGSVGLPGKNAKKMLGVPLIERTIRSTSQSRHLSAVYVSTDDAEIAQISENAGAIVIRRPNELSNNTASSESALLHALDWLKASGHELPEYLVFLQCTSVSTQTEDIDAVLEAMVDKGAAAAFSVVEDHGFIWQEDTNGFAEGVTHDHSKPRQRRQDIKPRYRETGAVYAMRVADFLQVGERFCGPTVLVPVSAPAVEIDDQNDWDLAEALLSKRAKISEQKKSNTNRVTAVVTDFDGVHTNDTVHVSQDGLESVTCNRRDGLGLELLRDRGIKLLILSKEANPVVKARAAKVKMDVLNQIDDKYPVLRNWMESQGLAWRNIVYIGNDVNDVECMKASGISFAPADAHSSALEVADHVLSRGGGAGAIREMCDFLIENGYVG